MAWHANRKDFTERCRCVLCGTQYVTSGIGFVVVDDLGQQGFAGPACKKGKCTNGGEQVPDLTGACIEPDSDGSERQASARVNATRLANGQITKDGTSRAISYLLLRTRLAQSFPAARYEMLEPILERYEAGNLLESDIKTLNTLAINSKYPKMSYRNLSAVYACDFWIRKFIEQNPMKNLDFIMSLSQDLHRRLRLTPSQLDRLNNNFDNTNGRKMIRIRLDAFSPDAGLVG